MIILFSDLIQLVLLELEKEAQSVSAQSVSPNSFDCSLSNVRYVQMSDQFLSDQFCRAWLIIVITISITISVSVPSGLNYLAKRDFEDNVLI